MKNKVLLWLTSILAVVFLAACGDSEEATTTDAEVASEFATNDNASYEFNQVIEDNDNYIFTLVDAKKTDEDDIRSMKITFDFENKLDHNVTLTANNLSMDGKMVDFLTYFFYEEVAAGKTATISLDVHEFDDYEYPVFNEDFEVEISITHPETSEEIGKHIVKGKIE